MGPVATASVVGSSCSKNGGQDGCCLVQGAPVAGPPAAHFPSEAPRGRCFIVDTAAPLSMWAVAPPLFCLPAARRWVGTAADAAG